jgi:hypothetical protein
MTATGPECASSEKKKCAGRPPAEGDGLFGGLAVLGRCGVRVLESGQLGRQPHAQLRVQLREGDLRQRLVEDLRGVTKTAVGTQRACNFSSVKVTSVSALSKICGAKASSQHLAGMLLQRLVEDLRGGAARTVSGSQEASDFSTHDDFVNQRVNLESVSPLQHLYQYLLTDHIVSWGVMVGRDPSERSLREGNRCDGRAPGR